MCVCVCACVNSVCMCDISCVNDKYLHSIFLEIMFNAARCFFNCDNKKASRDK